MAKKMILEIGVQKDNFGIGIPKRNFGTRLHSKINFPKIVWYVLDSYFGMTISSFTSIPSYLTSIYFFKFQKMTLYIIPDYVI